MTNSVEIDAEMIFIWTVLLGLGCSSAFAASPLEEKILQEREARLEAIGGDLNPLRETSRTSALSGAIIREGSVELQDPDAKIRSYSLKEIVQLALQTSRLIKASEIQTRNRRREESLASGFHKLNVDVLSGYNRADNAGEDPRSFLNRQITDLTQMENSFYAGFKATLPVYDSGEGDALNRMARKRAEVEELNALKARTNLLLDASQTFMDLIVAQEDTQILQTRLEWAKDKAMEAERNNRDERLPMESFRLRLEQQETSRLLMQARLLEKSLRQKIRQLIGLENEEQFGLLKQAKTRVLADSREGLWTVLQNFNPDLKILALQLEEQRLATRLSQASMQPKVDLLGSTTYARSNERQSSDEVRWLLGLELDWRVYDSNRSKIAGSIQRDRVKESELHKESLLISLRADLDYHFEKYVQGQSGVETAAKHLQTAKPLLFEAEERFRSNRLGRADLLDARISYRTALRHYYEMLKDMVMAKLHIFALTGKLDEQVF